MSCWQVGKKGNEDVIKMLSNHDNDYGPNSFGRDWQVFCACGQPAVPVKNTFEAPSADLDDPQCSRLYTFEVKKLDPKDTLSIKYMNGERVLNIEIFKYPVFLWSCFF